MQLAVRERIPLVGFESDFKTEIAVTSRDVEILNFILEMKFSSVEEVHQKFFKITRAGKESVSCLWARKRLLQLEKAGFLLRLRTQSETRRYYAVSDAGFSIISAIDPYRFFCRPVKETELFTFEHDKQVLKSRMLIELNHPGAPWISEKVLSENQMYREIFSKELRPDGIYTFPNIGQVAFEFEATAKAKNRIRDKIEGYVDLIRYSKNPSQIKLAHFVCSQESIYKNLKAEADIYGDIFKIEMASSFFTQGARG